MDHPLVLRDDHDIDFEQLEQLRLAGGWRPLGVAFLERQVRGSLWVVSAWRGPRLVGFCRALSDGVTNAYIATVVVATDHRGQGLGRALIERLTAGKDGIRWVLHAREGVHGFYGKLGFTAAPDMLWRDRSA